MIHRIPATRSIRNAITILFVVFLVAACGRSTVELSGRITDLRGASINGVLIATQNGRTMATSDASGMWRLSETGRTITVTPARPGNAFIPPSRTLSRSTRIVNFQMVTPIMGQAVATREEARAWLQSRVGSPQYLELVDYYYDIAPLYGIRADVALAQATHETGYFKFGGLVQPWQNNFAGIGATGRASNGKTSLEGANPDYVRFEAGVHGAIFSTPQAGVEAQIQHLYAYASNAPLPSGRPLISPRFKLVRRGTAPYVEYLGARQNPAGTGWATDPHYGFTIVNNHLEQMLAQSQTRKQWQNGN